jgi:hypothetical protein
VFVVKIFQSTDFAFGTCAFLLGSCVGTLLTTLL